MRFKTRRNTVKKASTIIRLTFLSCYDAYCLGAWTIASKCPRAVSSINRVLLAAIRFQQRFHCGDRGKSSKGFAAPQSDCLDASGENLLYPFCPNTFRGVEWGMDTKIRQFQSTELDADQWVRSIKESGGKMVVLVCKHHDGFNLCPPATRTIRCGQPMARWERQPGA